MREKGEMSDKSKNGLDPAKSELASAFSKARKHEPAAVPLAKEPNAALAEQSVEEVIETLINNKISGGPVVNENNELVGIISEGDCLKQISDSRYYNMPMAQDNVEKRMVKEVETIDGNMNVFDAANKFLESKRRRFPIVQEGKLIGLISQKDILKAALQLKGQNW